MEDFENKKDVDKVLDTIESKIPVLPSIKRTAMKDYLVTIYMSDIITSIRPAKGGPKLELKTLLVNNTFREALAILEVIATDIYNVHMLDETSKDRTLNTIINMAINKYLKVEE